MEALSEALKEMGRMQKSSTQPQMSGMDTRPQTLIDSVAEHKAKAETYNSLSGSKTDCPICKGRGDFMRSDDSGYVWLEDCVCKERGRGLARLKRSGLDESLTLENWQSVERWQGRAKELAMEFAEDPEGWFFVSGNPGTGKTHLCAGLCRLLIDKGMETRYMLWRDTAMQLNASANDSEEFSRLMKPLQTVKVLYIDDFFKSGGGKPSPGDKNRAFEIINARYNRRDLITVISSEWTTGAMDSIDEAVASRIYQRAGKYNLDFTGRPNWRRRG